MWEVQCARSNLSIRNWILKNSNIIFVIIINNIILVWNNFLRDLQHLSYCCRVIGKSLPCFFWTTPTPFIYFVLYWLFLSRRIIRLTSISHGVQIPPDPLYIIMPNDTWTAMNTDQRQSVIFLFCFRIFFKLFLLVF